MILSKLSISKGHLFYAVCLWMALTGRLVAEPQASSQAVPEPRPVVFLYVHGVANHCKDAENFVDRAEALHRAITKEFADTREGPALCINPKAEVFNWACMDGLERSRALTDYLLQQSSSDHAGKGSALKPFPIPFGVGLVLRQIYGITVEPLVHGGSGMASRDVRAAAFNFLHDPAWLTHDFIRTNLWIKLNERVTQVVDQYPNHDLVLAGHSGGSLLLYDYLFFSPKARRGLDGGETSGEQGGELPQALYAMSQRTGILGSGADNADRRVVLRGLITFGSQLGTVQASSFSEWDKREDAPINDFAKIFLRSGRFWLHVNHRNDPLGFHIPAQQLTFKNTWLRDDAAKREGIIVSYLTERSLLGRIPLLFLLEFGDPDIRQAHGWYWNNPQKFAETLRKQYEQGFRKPPKSRYP